MRKVNTGDYQELEADLIDLFKVTEATKELLDDINEKINDIVQNTVNENGFTLSELQDDFNHKKASLEDRISEIYGEQEGYYDDRSEKWRSSYNGESYYEWYQAWQYTHSLITDASMDFSLYGTLEDGEIGIDIGVTEQFELPEQQPERD